MPPAHTRLDPEGYYARLGLQPAASHDAIIAAFRRQALRLHPDVPETGNTKAFVALKQAYDVLSNRQRRNSYDVAAQQAEAARAFFRNAETAGWRMEAETADWFDLEPAAGRPRSAHPAPGHPTAGRAASGGPAFGRPSSGRPAAGPPPPGRPAASRPAAAPASGQTEKPAVAPRIADLTILVWVGLAAFLFVAVFEAALHLRAPAQVAASDGIRPNAAQVEPLPASAQRAVLYGPTPVRLAGTPNYYVAPSAGATVLWRKDGESDYTPVGQLPPFSSVQALRLFRQTGLVEVRFNETSSGYVDARRLMPGDAAAARRAYCGYNAGPNPIDGELLEQKLTGRDGTGHDRMGHDGTGSDRTGSDRTGSDGTGSGSIEIENRAIQPVVVKLRDAAGAVALSIYLGPGGHAAVAGVGNGPFHPDFAIGELWSRACNSFAAGMRARRMVVSLTPMPAARLVISPDEDPRSVDIPDEAFERE